MRTACASMRVPRCSRSTTTTTRCGCSWRSPTNRCASSSSVRPSCARRPRSRSRTDEMTPEELADRTAVADVLIRYFELVDTKDWDHMDEVFTEDTTAQWTPTNVMRGIDNVVGGSRHMIGGDEVVTFHHVAGM